MKFTASDGTTLYGQVYGEHTGTSGAASGLLKFDTSTDNLTFTNALTIGPDRGAEFMNGVTMTGDTIRMGTSNATMTAVTDASVVGTLKVTGDGGSDSYMTGLSMGLNSTGDGAICTLAANSDPDEAKTTTDVTYASLTGTFSEGELVTGSTSGAKGMVRVDDGVSAMEILNMNGTSFSASETLTGTESGATCTASTVSETAGASPCGLWMDKWKYWAMTRDTNVSKTRFYHAYSVASNRSGETRRMPFATPVKPRYIRASSQYSTSYQPKEAFDGIGSSNTNRWVTISGSYSNSDGGSYLLSESTNVDGSTVNGEWIQIDLQTKITVDGYATQTYNTGPRTWYLVGSNDLTNWTSVDYRTLGTAQTNNTWYDYACSSPGSYRFYRFIITESHNNASTSIGEIEMYIKDNTTPIQEERIRVESNACWIRGSCRAYNPLATSVNENVVEANSNTGGTNSNVWRIVGDGRFRNRNTSYGQISDEFLKCNVRDAPSQWDSYSGLTFRKFEYTFMPGFSMLGLISQEVSPHLPDVIMEAPLRAGSMAERVVQLAEGDEPFTTVDYSAVHVRSLGVLREALLRIEDMERRVLLNGTG